MKRKKVEWIGYIPDGFGHWDLPGKQVTEREARAAFRKMLGYKRLPAYSWVIKKHQATAEFHRTAR